MSRLSDARRWLRSIVVAGAAAVVLVGAGLVASPLTEASNFGGTQCDDTIESQCVAKYGNPHRVYLYPSLTSRQRTQTTNSINDYNAIVDSSIQLSIVPDREDGDVTVSYGNFGENDAWAYTTCEIAAEYGTNGAGDYCVAQLFRFNSVYLANYNSDSGTRAVACHELGHTLGLRHATSSANHPEYLLTCMHDPPKTSGTWRIKIRNHDRDLLQQKYPQ